MFYVTGASLLLLMCPTNAMNFCCCCIQESENIQKPLLSKALQKPTPTPSTPTHITQTTALAQATISLDTTVAPEPIKNHSITATLHYDATSSTMSTSSPLIQALINAKAQVVLTPSPSILTNNINAKKIITQQPGTTTCSLMDLSEIKN